MSTRLLLCSAPTCCRALFGELSPRRHRSWSTVELKKIVLKFTCHNNVSNQSVASTPAIFKSVLRSTASFGDIIIFWVLCRLALQVHFFGEIDIFGAQSRNRTETCCGCFDESRRAFWRNSRMTQKTLGICTSVWVRSRGLLFRR